jgi:bifunctional DNase/RNase
MNNMIPVEVVNVFLTAKGEEFIVLLRGSGDNRTLPISIGQLEAQSIAKELYHASFPRPLTHDLFKSALERLGCKVVKAVVCDLIDNTFYARLFLESKGETIEIDSRPSDAIALALRFTAPIFVEEKVMNESGVIFAHEKNPDSMPDQAGKLLNRKERRETSPLEALKEKLLKAIREERYEDAAVLRDEINKLTKSN